MRQTRKMPVAPELQWITPFLAYWQVYEPAVKCDLSSTAVVHGGELLFIDPVPLAAPALAGLIERARPAAILLTNGNHARGAAALRTLLGIPILAHETAADLLTEELELDGTLSDSGSTTSGMRVEALEGGAEGEMSIHFPALRWAIVGDALVHLPGYGFSLLPDKYCQSPDRLRQSLAEFARLGFDGLSFAHGEPLVHHGAARLRELLCER